MQYRRPFRSFPQHPLVEILFAGYGHGHQGAARCSYNVILLLPKMNEHSCEIDCGFYTQGIPEDH